MSFNTKELTESQKVALQSELVKRGVKFLPAQVVRRIVSPSSQWSVLGSAKRYKASLEVKRQAAMKATATAVVNKK